MAKIPKPEHEAAESTAMDCEDHSSVSPKQLRTPAFSTGPLSVITNLPTYQSDAFVDIGKVSDDAIEPLSCLSSRVKVTPPESQPPPRVITTDNTKCLIRVLRAKPESAPFQSAAILDSLNPEVAKLQETQRQQQRTQLSKNRESASRNAITRRRQITTSVSGKLIPTAVVGSSGPAASASSTADRSAQAPSFAQGRGTARSFDRMTFGTGIGSSVPGSTEYPFSSTRSGKRARRAQGWSSLPRSQRKECLRVSVAATVRSGDASESLLEINRVWNEDPARQQRVSAALRREMSEAAQKWAFGELCAYMDGAGLMYAVSSSKRHLSGLVRAHLRPDMVPNIADPSRGSDTSR